MKGKDDFLTAFLGNAACVGSLRLLTLDANGQYTGVEIARRTGLAAGVALREMRRLEKLGVVKRTKRVATVQTTRGKKKKAEERWTFDQSGMHARAVSDFIRDASPSERDTVLSALKRSGNLSLIVLSGTFVGDSLRPLDVLIAATQPNERRIERTMRALESSLNRELRFAVFALPELRYRMTIQDRLLRDTFDFPHVVLLDRTRVLS